MRRLHNIDRSGGVDLRYACRRVLYPDDLLSEVQHLARFGITQIDLRTGVATWTDHVYRLYGWQVGEVEPSVETLLSRVYPGDDKRVRAAFSRASKAQAHSPLEFRIVRPDGELRTLQVRVKLFSDATGVPVRMLCTTIDITEHKETAARLVFTDRMASVGTLAAGVAHEINNPLAFISANLELIATELGEPLSADIHTLLGETRVGVERIRNIVRGLNAFSRTDEDQRAPISVEQVLDLAVLMAGPQIRHRAQLERASSPLPEVVANQATLGQVFLNILVNATEAIPEGEVERQTISISTRTDDAGWAVIEIRDTGCGIPREIRGQIFDPFFTTKPVGKGTGLGLSICHGIVRSLGGEIGFTSSPGAGTTFTIALPPAVAPARATPEPVVMETPVVAAQLTKVMIIDDEVVFANALRRLLGRDHHQITIVHTGQEALARIAAGERFDAILCDLMMPAMSGMEVHQKIVAAAPEQAERMIFLTGGAFSPLAKQFLDRANNLWFDKPCDLQALRSAILRVARR
jgi:PAS domain S-box-containing protein